MILSWGFKSLHPHHHFIACRICSCKLFTLPYNSTFKSYFAYGSYSLEGTLGYKTIHRIVLLTPRLHPHHHFIACRICSCKLFTLPYNSTFKSYFAYGSYSLEGTLGYKTIHRIVLLAPRLHPHHRQKAYRI